MRKLTMQELGRLNSPEYSQVDKLPVTVVLDNVRSMHNVGSVFRTADAFRIERVMLCGITARPPHRDIHKTALGAEDWVPWQHFETTEAALQSLKNEGYTLIAIEQTDGSIPLPAFVAPQGALAVVFGNEVEGVGDGALAYCTHAIEIPQLGAKHSLNISVAAGIVLYALTVGRKD